MYCTGHHHHEEEQEEEEAEGDLHISEKRIMKSIMEFRGLENGD
jgi:hypothetical protein